MRILIASMLIGLSTQIYAQRLYIKSDFDRNELEKNKIVSNKIHEVKAYKYDFINGKFNEEGVLAEQKQYNTKGQPTYEYSTIDPELSYAKATKKTTVVQYSEDVLTDVGVQTVQAGTDYFEVIYELPSVERVYNYKNDTLDYIYEKFKIDNDSSYSIVKYSYFKLNRKKISKSINENITTKTNAWIVSTERDFFYNTELKVSGNGPWVYNYMATFSFDSNNNSYEVLVSHPFLSEYDFKLYKYNEQGILIAKKQGAITKQSYKYDLQNNLIFTEFDDLIGKTQIKYKYDNNKNMIEFERIQLKSNEKNKAIAQLRYKHCFYTYNDKNLLTERIDKNSAGETICKIKYSYWFDGDYTQAISDRIKIKMDPWLIKGKYESTLEYQERSSEANKAKQVELFKQDVINELGNERYNLVPLKMEYDADKECYRLTLKELAPIDLYVPRTEAEEFEKNADKYTIISKFILGNNGLELKSYSVKDLKTNKEYKSITE